MQVGKPAAYLKCKSCDARCCKNLYEHRIPLSEVEAFNLREDRGPEAVWRGADGMPYLAPDYDSMEDACAYLEGNRCTANDLRPFACRSFPLTSSGTNVVLDAFCPTAASLFYDGLVVDGTGVELVHEFVEGWSKAPDRVKNWITQQVQKWTLPLIVGKIPHSLKKYLAQRR